MKNFSAKNAEFETLKINNEAAISSADLGTAPNQIPLNKDLGSLAYMNAPQIEDLNVDTLELREIAAELSETAVDVFVYDTRKDSDGGAWRERTSHTSWHNEELNTATRGGRREFPAVAVIVAESNKVTIYDGDDPDLPMWMVFNTNRVSWSSSYMLWGSHSVRMLNGQLVTGSPAGVGYANILGDINFIKDSARVIAYSGTFVSRNTIVNRNIGDHWNTSSGSSVDADYPDLNLVANDINDVAMTVLPGAPIDSETGLPIPTIAVATDGGVSVIKDDGTVVDITQSHGGTTSVDALTIDPVTNAIYFTTDYAASGIAYKINATPIPSSDRAENGAVYNGFQDHFFQIQSGGNHTIPQLILTGGTIGEALDIEALLATGEGELAVAEGAGLDRIIEDRSGLDNSMIAHTTSKYNTGWMPGDIKLATLSDTTVEAIGESSDELIENNTFGTGTEPTGWLTYLGTSSVVNNQAVLNGSGVTDANLITEIDCVVGKMYEFKIDSFLSSGSNSYNINVSTGSGSLFHQTIVSGVNKNNTTVETTTIRFVATQTTHYVGVKCNGNPSNASVTIDNAYVKQTTELVTNGDFSTDVTASDGQTSGGWTSNKAELSIENGRLKIVDAGSSSAAYQAINTIAGKKYILSLSGQFNDGSDGSIQVRDANFTGTTLNSIDPVGLHETPTEFSLTFVAQSSTTIVRISPASASSFTATFDNISVRPAVDDRSVNNNGLQIVGAINKTPVAPGADLVAYSGFSEYNYLVQPYNADLDFGTGDFSIMGWCRSLGASQAYISVGPESATGARIISGVDSGNRWFFTAYDNTDDNNTRYVSRDLSAYSNNYDWVHLIAGRKDGRFFFYLNNKEMPDGNNTATDPKDLTNTNASQVKLTIGANWQKTAGGGELALVRISKTAPTAEQIAKIYRDEKPLFQDGAQATLYGTSDAVTALAYDDSDDLLHVGTASGRSVFNGLKRIDNTTTAVSTAISATEGLVIEQ